MAHPPSFSRPGRHLSRVELCPLPLGGTAVWIAGERFRASGVLRGPQVFDRAVLFTGPEPFSPTFAGLSRHLAARGIGSLALVPCGPSGEELVRAAVELLALRGAARVSMVAGGDAASLALGLASSLPEVEAVTLLSPAGVANAPADRLRGRPLRIFAGDDDAEARALAARAMPSVEVTSFRLAGQSLREVTNDLAAAWIPAIESDFR